MDFASYMREQSEKLNCRDYVNHLWNELQEHNEETEYSATAANDYSNHLPLLLEQFWEIALEKLKGSDAIEEIDEDLKVYLSVLIYQCVTQSQESISYNCVIYACEVYLHLLATSHSDNFYITKLYQSTLTTIHASLENAVSEKLLNRLVYKLRLFLKRSKLNARDLEVTLATLMEVLFVRTSTIYTAFDRSSEMGTVQYEALLSLKILLERETMSSRKFLITTYLFNGLRKHSSVHLSPHCFSMIQTNFRNVFKSLHHKFKEDNYKTFMNAFIHTWKHPDFMFYGEAVNIMAGLKQKRYRILLDILNQMMTSKTPHRNLFKLSLAVICFPPKYLPIEKVKVTNEILLRSILINCLSAKSDISNAAVESLAEILLSPDLQKGYIREPMKIILSCCREQTILNVPTILGGLQSLMGKKWTGRSKNKNLFVISVSIMLLCEEDYPGSYREVLESLSEEASPFDLKPFLPLLSETYLKMMGKNYKFTALQILKVIFKMALHPMASSTEFVKYLYMAMIYPNLCKGVTVKSELFIDSILTDDFNSVEFFRKSHTLGLIRNEHVTKLMGSLSSVSESNLRLLCAVANLTEYKELSIIADYINEHFMTICNHPHLTYLLYIYEKLFKNDGSMTRHHQNLKSNEIMVCFLKQHLRRQSLRWDSVPNGFALLKTLAEFTDFDEDVRRFKEEYDGRLVGSLQNNGSFLPLMYYSQLVIFGKVVPDEGLLKIVTDFLSLCSNEVHRRSPQFNPKLWIGCLILYTNICVIRNNLVENCFHFLQVGMNCTVTIVKLASMNMAFDLCNMITHNFEDLIRYMFKQLIYGDSVFKRTCLLKIDRLIRDDYLKLELQQFVIFVSILGERDCNLSDYLRRLLAENFFVSHASIIAKHFVPLVVHINGYKKHPIYKISNSEHEVIQIIAKNVSDRRKIYKLLFNSLPMKARFNIVHILATTVLESVMKGLIKCDDGFWKMVKDSIFIFKLISASLHDEDSNHNYYKKVSSLVSKYILQKTEYAGKSLYPEYHKEIVQGTETLLKLLFFSNNDEVQKHIRISVVDAIMCWTHFLLADLVHLVHVDRSKEIQNYYLKFDRFFTENVQDLRYTEESFENGSSSNNNLNIASISSMFNVSAEYVPPCDDD